MALKEYTILAIIEPLALIRVRYTDESGDTNTTDIPFPPSLADPDIQEHITRLYPGPDLPQKARDGMDNATRNRLEAKVGKTVVVR